MSFYDTVFKKSFSSGKAKKVPKAVAKELDRKIKKSKYEIYGSAAAATWAGGNAREPDDVDIATYDVKKTTRGISNIFRKRKVEHRVKYYPQYGSSQIQIRNGEEWETVVDIQDRKKHDTDFFDFVGRPSQPPICSKNGYIVQSPKDQMYRKTNSTRDPKIPAHRIQKDNYDAISTARVLNESGKLKARAYMARREVGKAMREDPTALATLGAVAQSVMSRAPTGEMLPALRDPVPREREKEFVDAAVRNKKRFKNLDHLDFDEAWKLNYSGRRR